MKMNFFKREARVGIMVIVAIFVLYFGLNFLKGIDIFSPLNNYYASYDNIGGLVPSSPVYVKGFKVGQVDEVKYDFSKQKSFVIKFSVSKDIQLPKGTIVQLYDDGLMGGKAIQLIYAPISVLQAKYEPNDTIESQVGIGLLTELTGELLPKIETISTQADSLIRSMRVLVESKDLKKSLESIERSTADLSFSSTQLKNMMNNDVPHILGDVNIITSDLKQITGNLKKIDYASTFASIDHTIANLNLITEKMNSSEGTIGSLLNNKDLYINLTNATSSANKLMIDLQKNPKRYVHFSVFGKKSE